MFAEQEAALLVAEAPEPDELERMIVRRVAGEPLEHVLGWAEFMGARYRVSSGVFVPRRRSEFLVETALAHLRATSPPLPLVLDLCCGSGALGAAIAARAQILLVASDVDPVATVCAGANVPLDANVLTGDLCDAVDPGLFGTVDLIIASPPYVPTGEIAFMPAEARVHEPRRALDGGVDGLDVVRRIVAEAARWLRPAGVAMVEIAREQAEAARGMPGVSIATCDDRDATVLIARPASLVPGT